jgi:hypothetical protein
MHFFFKEIKVFFSLIFETIFSEKNEYKNHSIPMDHTQLANQLGPRTV